MDNRLLVTQYYGCWIVDLYHRARTHLSLEKDSPTPRRVYRATTVAWWHSPKSAACIAGTSDAPPDAFGFVPARPTWRHAISIACAAAQEPPLSVPIRRAGAASRREARPPLIPTPITIWRRTSDRPLYAYLNSSLTGC
jgi:hypothetical protein